MNWVKLIFFGIFYILLGTAGISIPIFLNGIVLEDISIGLVTIVVSTVGYASTEKVLQLYDDKTTKFEVIINLSMMVVALFCTIIVAICISKKNQCLPLCISVFSYIVSCGFWWYHNRDNTNLTENDSVLGGSSNQFNK